MAELIRKLKDYEENHPCAALLERERTKVQITPADLKELAADAAIDANDTEALLAAGDLECGFAVLPGQGIYTQQTIELKGVTTEMINWWYAYYPLESYRYLMWMPESHHSVAIADCDREKILNPIVPIAYKTRGVLHAMLKDEGRGLKEVNVRFQDPQKCGFDMGKVMTSDIGTLITGWHMEQALDMLALPNRFPMRNYAVETIIGRNTADGAKVNIFTWLGWRYDCDGKAACCLPPFVELPKEAAFGPLLFAPNEWIALTEFLPSLYENEGGEVK